MQAKSRKLGDQVGSHGAERKRLGA